MFPSYLTIAALSQHHSGKLQKSIREELLFGADWKDIWKRIQPEAKAASKIEKSIEKFLQQGGRALTILDQEYPDLLKNIYSPPLILFYKGESPQMFKRSAPVAVVGSRRCDRHGREAAENFSEKLANAGICIVSGLAYGIDASAHLGALRAASSFSTAAVLGHGLLSPIYPRANEKLARRIIDQGGSLISHYLPDAVPLPPYFLERNRIIAGLSRVVLIIQANEKSGALATARCALEEGREVCAVPGPVFDDYSFGSNRLIQQGANVVLTADDILQLIPELRKNSDPYSGIQKTKIDFSDPLSAQLILTIKEESPVQYDYLFTTIEQNGNLDAALLELELLGLIGRLPGNYFEVTQKGREYSRIVA
jgi:DNA processing protein